MGFFYLDNAISWAQFRIRGGWRSAIAVTGTYAAGVFLVSLLLYEIQTTPRGKMDVLASLSIMVLVAQTIVLGFSANSIGQSIRRDRTGLQIESHRLMPLGPVQAVAGYIAGGAVRMLMLSVVNFVQGVVLYLARGVPVRNWVLANGVLLAFCISGWTIMALSAFVSRGVYWGFVGIVTLSTFSAGQMFFLFPALLAFITPVQQATIFGIRSPGIIPNSINGLMVGLAAQMVVAVLCLRGAARKYARDDAVALTPAYSLAVFGVWSILSWFGITRFQELKPVFTFNNTPDWTPMVVGSLCASLLVGLLPIASVVLQIIARDQRRSAGEEIRARRWPLFASLALCVGFTLVILAARVTYMEQVYVPAAVVPKNLPANTAYWTGTFKEIVHHTTPVKTTMAAVQIGVASAIFFAQMGVLMRGFYPSVKRANVLLGFVIGALWFLPMLADDIYYVYFVADSNVEPKMDRSALCSPIGTFLQAVREPLKNAWWGIGCQFLMLMIFFGLYQVQSHRNRRKRRAIETKMDARMEHNRRVFPATSAAS